ncbi:TPA: PilN family type IVB pilus formation outer membrane protein [Escherichia coli]|uniref:Type IV pilus outer membrane secretin lipoprotein n=1 Tax=Escherichia coli O81 (strain ED1a) TaxID=585397 RepID=B7LIT9_ECO81|nr:PilN family type IVB pilus formation outer membrane protein [Escherichia coli]EHK4078398.1 PilN family type IVB pilus formation outer membrane protein [Shigella flexneri]EFC4554359.1 PilN family type IVB pilus formation outer membrane protein [Escherichia coli]EGF4804474.1 PilN family type IVB pilus formation outer membrane protein [Escherichia coli]EIX0884929.1 PilN family type IVB pilus formation outer membrane protein [Escherichia coli]EJD4869706.1 PilN family type IVB pilus formation ou
MNKKILVIMISAALLQGCASFRQLESTRKEAVAEQQRAREMMSDLRTRMPVVKESSRQWINPRPVMDKNTGKTVPGCPIVIHTRQSITLQQVVQRITESCHIPVRITPDVLTYLNTSTTGSTQQIQGALPPPDASGMVPLAAIGASDTPQSRLPGNASSLSELNASGLTSLLNAVSSRLGISWRYDGSHITFYYLDTRTFPITYMDSQVAYNATVVSGTMSSNGSSGGDASDAISGDASNTQTTTVDMKSALYQDVKNAVTSMLTPGVGRMFMSTGFITVTDNPQVLETVRAFIEKRNEEMKRQVVLNVEILSIRKTRNEQAGIDWNAVFSDRTLGLSLGSTFTGAASDAITGGVSIVDGKLTGSKAFLKALSSQGDVSVVTQNSAVTKNLTPVPMQIANQQSYIESVTTDTTANVGSSTSLNAATITTGFNMTLLPFILPDSQTLQLLYSMSLSDKPVIENYESGGSKAQLPNVDLKTINQTVDLKSGQTVIISGFQQSGRRSGKQGVGTPGFFGLGGGINSENDDTILVVLITPNII